MQSVSLEPFCLYSVVAEAGHVQTRHLQQMTCSDVIGRNDAQSKALDPLGFGLVICLEKVSGLKLEGLEKVIGGIFRPFHQI